MAQLCSLAMLMLMLGMQSHALAEKASGAQLITEEWKRTEQTVRKFMRTHTGNDPDQDGMDELKRTNPDAFAIVQALMTKRSLGLLNPMHPMSKKQSTAAAEDDSSTDGSQSGPSMALEASAATTSVYSAPHPHRDWLNWRPAESAASDDAMVSSVLGEVADLKSTATQPAMPPSQEHLAVLSNSRTTSSSVMDASSAEAGTTQQTAGAAQHASGMPSFDWGNPYSENTVNNAAAAIAPASLSPPSPPVASMTEENSYLKGLDLRSSGNSGSSVSKADDGPNKLTSFSWSTALVQKHSEPVAAYVSSPYETPDDKASLAMGWGSLGNWLGNSGGSKQPAGSPALVQQQEEKPLSPAAPVNKYLADLK